MANEKQTYEELEQQLEEAYQLITALRGGEIDSVVAIVTKLDVTLLRARKLEAELRQSEANFHRTLDDSPMGIHIVTADGEILYANWAVLNLYGYNGTEELQATPAKKRYTPESYAEHQVRKEKRQRGEYVPSNYEISIARKDGKIRHLEVFRKEVLWNGKPQFQVLYNDVTERKKAEAALLESEVKYSSLVEKGNDGIIISKSTEYPPACWGDESGSPLGEQKVCQIN
jgi:PAS domain S-box-containing protein